MLSSKFCLNINTHTHIHTQIVLLCLQTQLLPGFGWDWEFRFLSWQWFLSEFSLGANSSGQYQTLFAIRNEAKVEILNLHPLQLLSLFPFLGKSQVSTGKKTKTECKEMWRTTNLVSIISMKLLMTAQLLKATPILNMKKGKFILPRHMTCHMLVSLQVILGVLLLLE